MRDEKYKLGLKVFMKAQKIFNLQRITGRLETLPCQKATSVMEGMENHKQSREEER